MRALRIHGYGGPEVMRLEEAPRPVPGPGQVLVKVRAASVNPIDWKMRRGMMAKVFPINFPRVLGRDCAGELEGGLVAGVSDPRTDGTHAEYALLPADQAAPIPEGLSPEEAASLCVTGISAYIALVENAKVSGGHRVLVHAGAGGVGSIAIQIARKLGCEVFATASPANHDYCRSLGAAGVIDYKAQDFTTAIPPCDVILDTIGGETHQRSLKMLKPGGTVVALAADPIPKASQKRNDVRDTMVNVRATRERLLQLFQWATSGTIKPQVTHRFKPEEAGKAYAISESGHARGKMVILF
ncbi:MAG TPA: NADP-dependent oxidoreductase [Burkholderiales bacterium]|nr:NADP-dependent oxidoreductase [Burkholderiales bacterium]